MHAIQCDPACCVIAMAASVGGLQALSVILGGLPADFPAAIAIVMHLAPDHIKKDVMLFTDGVANMNTETKP